MASLKITACIIAQNEEKAIGRALRSLSFADEIIVVDGGSTDQTVAISESFSKVKVVKQLFQGFTAQRNRALKESSGQWVFFLDADEEASAPLAKRLVEIAKEDPSKHPHCYSVRREEFFLGKHLSYGPGNPSFQWRYFKKEKVTFEGAVHEYPKFEGAVGEIADPIFHWPHLNIERFLVKLNHYTTLEAMDRFSQGQKTSLAHAFLTFFSTFFKNGIRYGGFLNGEVGFVLVLLESFSRTVRHLKLWVLWQVYEKKLNIDLGFALPKPGDHKAPAASDLNKPTWKENP